MKPAYRNVTRCPRISYAKSIGVLLCSVVGFSSQLSAQDEIARFKLTDVSADFIVGYTLDDRDVGTTYTRSDILTQELFFRTRSYVYHPALIDMRINGGPVFVQGVYDSDSGSNRGSDSLFNYDASFRFLARKSYPFTLYLRRDHPEVTTGILGRFLARTDEYGINGVLRPPLLPMFVYWDTGHWTSKGSGFGSVVDETVDRASLRTTVPYGAQSVSLNLDWNTRLSASGSPGLPIQDSETDTFGARLSADNIFGAEKNVRFNQNIRLLKQDTQTARLVEIETLSYSGNLRWDHSDRANSFADYAYVDQDRTDSWTRSQNFNAGSQYRFRNGLQVGGNGRFSANDDPGFRRDRAGGRINAQYGLDLPVGRLSLSGSVGMDRTDQRASRDTASIFEEPHELTGVTRVPLNEAFVVDGSVVVTNETRTQTYIEEFDYRLVTIGSTTTIERIATGNIFDGERVLVSYDYEIGGTAEYDTLSQSVSANLGISRFANVYLRFNNAQNEILSGFLSTPLNDLTRFEAGGRVDIPLNSGWSLGGEYRYTHQDEEIAPYVGNRFDGFIETGHYWGTNFRFGLLAERVDYEFSTEDVDLIRYFLTVSCRLPGASRLAYTVYSGRDDGGSILREDVRQNLQFDWTYRRVSFSLRAVRSDVSQGLSRRDHTRVAAELRRRF